MNQLVKLSLALTAVLGVTSTIAHADKGDIDIGAFLGVHTFSQNNELGVLDTPDSDSQSNGLALGLRGSYGLAASLAVEGEFGFVPTEMRDSGEGSTVFLWRAHGLYSFADAESTIRPFALAGAGFMSTSQSGDGTVADHDLSLYAGGGASYRLNDDWSLRGDARLILPPSSDGGFASTDFEVLLGASFSLGSGAEDVVADEPIVEETGCVDGVGPDCPADEDGDGIVGDADTCPEKPETVNSYQDEDGCPDEVPDTDGDGINDLADACKDTAEDMDSFEDTDGCPEEDNDKDGIVDGSDGCPLENGPIENRGCPDTDGDADTVVDRLDNCPAEAGTAENHGCAKAQLVVITKDRLQILDKVFFRRRQASIMRRSYALLDNLAVVMVNHPEIKKVEIAGHTDSRGADQENLALSQNRAEAVARYLVKKGVHHARLKPVGYGETEPAAEGDDKEAWEANRRVEFKLITK